MRVPTSYRCCPSSTELLERSCGCSLSRTEDDGNLSESSRDGVAVEHCFGAGCEGVVRYPRQRLLKTNRELQAGEVGSETAMYSGPESEVPVLATIEYAPIGLVELVWIAVSGGVVHQYRLAGAEGLSGKLDVLGDSSRYAVNRSAEANE